MSGVAGICYFDGRVVEASTLDAMVRALAHRGADGSGIWIDGSIGFAHLMRWTTPESLTETLPLFERANELVITADARIDNRDELFPLLHLTAGSKIGDSALILAAYEKWGENCPEKLVGDFAFAIYDRRKRTLFAARDRIGVKPFYYHHKEDGAIVFASETSPIFEAAGVEKRGDRDAIRDYFDALALASDRTLFEGIRRLPPACGLTLRDGRMTVRRYWTPLAGQGRRRPDLARHTEEFRYLFAEAVRAQSRSAYPVGCLLGGGLDSSSVLCVASRLMQDKSRLSAFSMIFDRLPCDEREFIARAIEKTGVAWYSTVADASLSGGWKGLSDCYGAQRDWPIQDLPMQALWALLDESKRRGVRVMLTGVGGDTLTTGSPFYLADLFGSLRWLALVGELKQHRFSRRVLWSWMLEPLLPRWLSEFGRRIETFARGKKDASLFEDREESEIWKEQPHLSRARFATAGAWQEAHSLVNPRTSIALDGWWDALGQHGGLEFRHPFFDCRLIDFVLSVPSEEKRRHGSTKLILREAMKGVLPEVIRLRKDKAEFSPIFAAALDSMSFAVGSLTLAQTGIIDEKEVAKIIERRAAEPTPLTSFLLWQLATLEAWFNLHFNPRGEQA
jgi:asparagine synthase (glutamine-hydrolysing)